VGWIQVGKKGKKKFFKKYKKPFYIKIEIQGKMECKYVGILENILLERD